MKKTVIALFMIVSTLVILMGAAVILVPWKDLLADQLAKELQASGLPNATLSLDAIGWNKARLKNLTFGDREDPLTIPEVTADYDTEQVQKGRLKSLTLNGLKLSLSKGEEGWAIEGWPKKSAEEREPLIPPVTPEYKNLSPADQIVLENGNLSVSAPSWHLAMPLAGRWQKTSRPEIALQKTELSFEGRGTKVSGLLEASASLNAEKKRWEGTWSLKSMTVLQKTAQEDIPPADLSGTLSADEKTLTVTGKIKGESKAYDGAFKYTVPFAEPEKATLLLSDISMPWQDGVLSTKNVSIPLSGNKPYTLDLKISKASIAKLMQDFTGEYVRATGTISGSFPVRIGQDGKITVGKGTLSADKPGQLSMPPESIPGEGAQMQLTRDILEQFDYKLLSLTTEQDGKKGLAIILRIEGNNPKVENGRPVILNIRLTGDLLDFITSSAIVFTSPQTLIQQGNK